jgi:hypothetical protein
VALRPSGGVVLKRSDDANILHCYVSQVFCARVTHSGVLFHNGGVGSDAA